MGKYSTSSVVLFFFPFFFSGGLYPFLFLEFVALSSPLVAPLPFLFFQQRVFFSVFLQLFYFTHACLLPPLFYQGRYAGALGIGRTVGEVAGMASYGEAVHHFRNHRLSPRQPGVRWTKDKRRETGKHMKEGEVSTKRFERTLLFLSFEGFLFRSSFPLLLFSSDLVLIRNE